jgi:hypothetical protein
VRSWPVRSLPAVDQTAAGEVVGGELHLDAVADEDTDAGTPHLARQVGKDLVVVVELHLEVARTQGLGDDSLKNDDI